MDLLDKLLCVNPLKRVTADEALNHPYLKNLHDEADEPNCESKEFDFKFEYDPKINLEDLRSLILEEVNFYKK